MARYRITYLFWIPLCFLLGFAGHLQAQELNVDSCLRVLRSSKDDTNKVVLLAQIAWNISYRNLQSGVAYGEQGVALAEKLRDERRYCYVYHVLGAIYLDMAEQGKALNLFLKAISYGKRYNQQLELGHVYNSVGNFYAKQGDYRQAVSYYLQAVESHQKAGSEKSVYTPYNNLSSSYLKLNKMDSAIYYINLCVTLNENNLNTYRLTYNYITLSEIYTNGKTRQKALMYARKAADMARTLNDEYTLAKALSQLGTAYYANGKDGEAISAFEESVKLSRETGDLTTSQSTVFLLSHVYEERGEYKKALSYYKSYKSFRDSTMNRENLEQIRTAEAKYENDKKQREIELLGEKQKRTAAESEKGRLYLYFAGAGILALGVLLVLLFNNNRAKQKANQELENFNSRIREQKELVEEKNREITDSINYAKRIQQSILTSDNYFSRHTRDFFILFRPKDIVSGDFYWALAHNRSLLVMTADCTGHGVPGAMMSMMGVNFLNEIVNERGVTSPAAVLNQLRKDIVKALNPEDSLTETKDGMDCCLCRFDFDENRLTYANANNRFYLIRDGKLTASHTNKMPVGAGHNDLQPFEEWTMDLRSGDLVVSLTDGYADQFGGPKGKKFKYKQLEELLLSCAHLPMKEIQEILNLKLDEWRGNLEQVDDVCLIGIRV